VKLDLNYCHKQVYSRINDELLLLLLLLLIIVITSEYPEAGQWPLFLSNILSILYMNHNKYVWNTIITL